VKCSAPLAVLVLGVLIACGALLYAVVLVGVPSADPTPAVAAAEAHVEHVSNWWISAGLILILIGTSWLCICRLLRAGRGSLRV
jgi:hypothetical protein